MPHSVDSGAMTGYVAAELREMIFTRKLTSNDRIRQEQIARQFGTSRIPVREALRQLESEGLVVIRPNSGARVASLDLSECIETYKIRERLEPLAIAESIPYLTEEQQEEVVESAKRVEEASDDSAAWLQRDRDFHLLTYAGVPTPRLMKMIESYWNTTQHYRRVLHTTFGEREFEVAIKEHFLIADAVTSRNIPMAELLVRGHIERARHRLSAHADLFDH